MTTRGTTSTCTSPTRPSRRQRRTAWCRWAPAAAAEQEAEADRLVSLGASRVDWDRFPDDPDFIVLADTEGNRFCIVNLGHEHRPPAPDS